MAENKNNKVIEEEKAKAAKAAEEKKAKAAKATEEKKAKAAKAPVKVKLPKLGEIVSVVPVKGSMFEPFEHVKIPTGGETKVKFTSWVQSQVTAKLLTLV